MQVILDANCMHTREQAHAYLREKLSLPSYYGGNLDALYDCLTEYDDLDIIIKNYDAEDTYAYSVIQVMEDAGTKVEFE